MFYTSAGLHCKVLLPANHNEVLTLAKSCTTYICGILLDVSHASSNLYTLYERGTLHRTAPDKRAVATTRHFDLHLSHVLYFLSTWLTHLLTPFLRALPTQHSRETRSVVWFAVVRGLFKESQMVIGDSLQISCVGVRLNPAILRRIHSQTRFWVEFLNAFFNKGEVEQLFPANDIVTAVGGPDTFAASSCDILHDLEKVNENSSGFEHDFKKDDDETNNDDDGDQDQKKEGCK